MGNPVKNLLANAGLGATMFAAAVGNPISTNAADKPVTNPTQTTSQPVSKQTDLRPIGEQFAATPNKVVTNDLITSKNMSWEEIVSDFKAKGLIDSESAFSAKASGQIYFIQSGDRDVSSFRKLRTGILNLMDRGVLNKDQAKRLLGMPSLFSSMGFISQLFSKTILAPQRTTYSLESINEAIGLLETRLSSQNLSALSRESRTAYELGLIDDAVSKLISNQKLASK